MFESTTFEQAFAEGASYSFDQAVALALGEEGVAADRTTPCRGRRAHESGGLTRREREVAGLLAEGLSNRDIAAQLVISQRTVETHVDNILGKLGMTSRGQVASWVAAQGDVGLRSRNLGSDPRICPDPGPGPVADRVRAVPHHSRSSDA